MGVPTLNQAVPSYDIVIKQNADFSMALCIVERDDNGDAVVVDTSGWSVVMQIRKEPAIDSPVILEATTANGRIVTGIQGEPDDPVNIDIKIPKSVTASLTYFGCAGYDLLAIYPDQEHDYYVQGQAILQPSYSWEVLP